MRKAVLFDLDGTLLPMDMDLFLKEYLESITKVSSHLVHPREMAGHIMNSTMVMVSNVDRAKTNEEVFMEDFEARTGIEWAAIFPLFNRFYEEEFDSLRRIITPNPLVPKMIDLVKEKGYRTILATSPIFPRKAIMDRIDWAGLDAKDFELITSYEDMHATKPNLEYYQEILDKTGLTGDQCIMIGNDAEEDLVAAELGMKVFWLKEYGIHRGSEKVSFDAAGSYQKLYDWLSSMPDVNEGQPSQNQ